MNIRSPCPLIFEIEIATEALLTPEKNIDRLSADIDASLSSGRAERGVQRLLFVALLNASDTAQMFFRRILWVNFFVDDKR